MKNYAEHHLHAFHYSVPYSIPHSSLPFLHKGDLAREYTTQQPSVQHNPSNIDLDPLQLEAIKTQL